MKLLMIGFGNMGSAICEALLNAPDKLFDEILVMDHSRDKMRAAEEMGARAISEFEPVDVALLAVKPQDILEVMPQVESKLVISIAAGVSLEKLQAGSEVPVVRVMPNTPALVGQGASGWVASSDTTDEQKDLIKKMLESFGVAIEVKNDDEIDAVTALSGSGPAYVFHFLESLIAGAKELGLNEEDAKKLAVQTVLGSAELAKNETDIAQLRKNVTSKGGTTEKALSALREGGFESLINKAMQAAYARAKEL
jgi:pyrroline-5-carboxylate reductase